MNGPTSRSGYITIRVKIQQHVILWSGGTTYEIGHNAIYILPKELKNIYGQWNPQIGQYVVLTRHGEVIHVPDNILPSNLDFSIKYTGKSVERFRSLLYKVLMRYYKGQPVVKLPLYDKDAYRLALCLARMANLETFSDVV
jgi:hypothetical protein